MMDRAEDLLPAGARVDNIELMRLKYALLNSRHKQRRGRRGTPGGERLSKRRGQGLDFAEVRAYQPGDDVRAIHWRVTARSGKAHTKIFHEQREQPLLLMLDASLSMHFGTRKRFKIVQAFNLASLLAWYYALAGERVALVMVDGERSWGTAPSHGSYAVAKAVEAMLRCWRQPPAHDYACLYAFIPDRMRAHARIVFIGDSFNIARQHEIFLGKLARQNEIQAVAIYDPMEQQLPDFDLAFTTVNSNKNLLLNAADSEARTAFRQDFVSKQQQIGDNFARLGARYTTLATDASAMQHFWTLA